MRRLLYILLVCCTVFQVKAQVIEPLGYGLIYTPELICATDNGIAAVYIDDQNEFQVSIWNGHFWYTTIQPNLPEAGMNSFGMLEIKDMKFLNGHLYLMAEHTLDLSQNVPNYVLKWDGSTWQDLSSDKIDNALVLNEMIWLKNSLQVIGIFSGNSQHYNIAKYKNNSWALEGNLITKNINNDSFVSTTSANDKTYATGSFTDPSIGTVSMVEWDGAVWQNTSFPPFLDHNDVVGLYGSNLVVYGNNNFNTETVKVQNGTSWSDISSGLENFTVNGIDHFASANGKLYATGDIKNGNSETVKILVYDGQEWSELNTNVNHVDHAISMNNQLYVSGDYADDRRLNHVGRLMEKGMLIANVFNDKDGDCVKDAGEEFLVNYPLVLDNEIEYLLSDKNGMVYLPATVEQHKLNASAHQYWQPTCSDVNIDVTEQAVYSGYLVGVKLQSNIVDVRSWISDNQSYVHNEGEYKRAMVCAINDGSYKATAATLTLSHDAGIRSFTSERSYDSYTNNIATWTLDIEANSKECFYVDFRSNTKEEITINTDVELNGQSDQNSENNSSALKYKTGSTLVNAKASTSGEYIPVDQAFMNYKIGFKNQGINNAVEVKIVDVLDEDIVPSVKGMEYLYSHSCEMLPVQYTILDNGKWQYKFIWEYKDIDLSNNTGDESEGFLDFKIHMHPNTLERGGELCNDAEIFFSYKAGSYNEPIYTNEVCSNIGGSVGVDPISISSMFEVSPVPADDVLNIVNNSGQDQEISLINNLGQTALTSFVSTNTAVDLDISELSAGVYFVRTRDYLIQRIVVH
ncbi:MAG: T9SS type A sorting domain-containing protein [Bacteroidia bacterium]